MDEVFRVSILRKKKNNYCDKHEDKANIEYREKIVKEYFKHEQNIHRLVHLTKDKTIKLENNEEEKM